MARQYNVVQGGGQSWCEAADNLESVINAGYQGWQFVGGVSVASGDGRWSISQALELVTDSEVDDA